jgi:hypothetical protein
VWVGGWVGLDGCVDGDLGAGLFVAWYEDRR